MFVVVPPGHNCLARSSNSCQQTPTCCKKQITLSAQQIRTDAYVRYCNFYLRPSVLSFLSIVILIRPPGTLVPEDLMFTADVFPFFIRRATSELPQPISVKLCHMIAIWAFFILQVQKFWALPPKKLGAQNMQNSARFQTTSDFDREYLRKESRYRKSENTVITGDYLAFREKSPLWSTNYRELDVSLEPPKLNFSGDYISALRGCWPLKF